MSWFEEAGKITVNDFGGAVSLLEASDIPLGKAIEASNLIFRPGRVETRPGFGFALPADGEQRELFSWSQGLLGGAIDWLAYLCGGTSIKLRNLATPATGHTIASGLPPSSRASFAPWGQRLYVALQSSAMRGVYHAQVWDGNSSHQMANCFQRPLLYMSEVTLAPTTPMPGSVTQGSHWLGVIFQTVEGFWTKPSPAFSPSLEFAPAPVNCAGGTNLRATLVPTTVWPSWITKVQLVMTTAANSSQFYLVPGTLTDVSAYRGLPNPFWIDVDIDDATLREADPEIGRAHV